MAKIELTRWGLKHDVRGWHVSVSRHNRTLLGEVYGAYYDSVKGKYFLKVKHKNNDALDDKIENLRIATLTQNRINSLIYKNSLTGYKWVSYHKKWKNYLCWRF